MAWFKDWFDSPYYHLLYGKRDENEAGVLIHRLIDYLAPQPGAKMLDLACGKGRHSRILSELGFDVTGLDLSENSIAEAQKHSSENLHFVVHDMRKPFKDQTFDYVFNLFTSFGYFDNESDDIRVLQSVHQGLKSKGIFILDYFNADLVLERIRSEETKEVNGIKFSIHKHIADDRIIKTIKFDDNGRHCQFEEKVSLYTLDNFTDMCHETHFEILDLFGDYALNPFDRAVSERLILITRKI
jgi:SAM-dependent methyltransferase